MSPLQCPRPSPPADADIRLPGSIPCVRRDVRDVQGMKPAGNSLNTLNSDSITFLYQTISHTFSP
ncbi:unnamed protein product [Staurois parvus]|uniref:Uncharacterized protein n=1 Tax=Staurois parvus TaxID=386267 RepID=A0ABN9CJU9_9NEOB|nr:unnamed protein product [Staurois parvus]